MSLPKKNGIERNEINDLFPLDDIYLYRKVKNFKTRD